MCRPWLRVRSHEPLALTGGYFLYGHMRRTDFLPVGGSGEDEVLERGYDSLSDEDEDGPGVEHACGENVFNVEVSSFAESSGGNEFQ